MCCNNNRRTIRQASQPIAQNKNTDSRKIARPGVTPVPINRQLKTSRPQCAKCGNTTMLVHIAGRERHQCTNVDCRLIVR